MSVSAGFMPTRKHLAPLAPIESPGIVWLATEPDPAVSVKGSEVRIVRCVLHGVAYDSERETCPECAAGSPPEPSEDPGLAAGRGSS